MLVSGRVDERERDGSMEAMVSVSLYDSVCLLNPVDPLLLPQDSLWHGCKQMQCLGTIYLRQQCGTRRSQLLLT